MDRMLGGGILLLLFFFYLLPDSKNSEPGGQVPVRPENYSGSYELRNVVYIAITLVSLLALGYAVVYGISIGFIEKQPQRMWGGFAAALVSGLAMMKGGSRIVWERSIAMIAASGSFPISGNSAYSAVTSVGGIAVKFNLIVPPPVRPYNLDAGSAMYTVDTECRVSNPAGARIAVYRDYLELPIGLYPWRASAEELKPFIVRRSVSGVYAKELSALREVIRAAEGMTSIRLHYALLNGNVLRARFVFSVLYLEEGSKHSPALLRLQSALEATAKTASLFT